MNWENIKTALSAGGNGLIFVAVLAVAGAALYLLFLAGRSVLRASKEDRWVALVFAGVVLVGVALGVGVYPVFVLDNVNTAVIDSQDIMIELAANIKHVVVTGFTAYQDGDVTVTVEPGASPTLPPETETPEAEATATATPLPLATIDPEMTPLNPSEMFTATPEPTSEPATPTPTQTTVPTIDPDLWNPQTPPPTPARDS